MSSIYAYAKYDTSLDIGIKELSYSPSEYSQFRLWLKNLDTGDEHIKTWTDSSTSGDSSHKRIYGLDRASEYEARVYATFDGEEYQAGTYFTSIKTYAESVSWAQLNQHPNGVYFAWSLNSCDEYMVKLEYGSNSVIKWAYPSDFDSDMGMVLFDEEVGNQSINVDVLGYKNNIPAKQGWGYMGFIPKVNYSKPSISVSDSGFVTISKTGYYTVIEYEKVNTASAYNYTKEERDFFMDTHFSFIESGLRKEGLDGVLNRWNKQSVGVQVTYYSSVSGVEPLTNSWIDEWCSEASYETGLSFSRVTSGGDIQLFIGDHSDFGFSTGDTFQNGEWDSTVDENGNLTSAWAKVTASPIAETYKSLLWEELSQCLGCGYDQYYNIDSMHVDLAGNNIESIQGIDSRILALLYKEGLTIGMSRAVAARLLNAVNKVYTSASTYQLEALDVGTQYRARAYGVDSSNNYSYKSNWVYFTPISQRPDNWDWNSKLSASDTDFEVLASDWNAFILRINEFLSYKGFSQQGFTPAAPDGVAWAYQFKDAALAIDSMSPPAGVADACKQVASSDGIYRWFFINLQEALNSII